MPGLISSGSEWLCGTLLCLSLLMSLSWQNVRGCAISLCFEPANDAWPYLSRWWVTVVPCWVQAYWCPCLDRMWVTVLPHFVFSILTMPLLDPLGCEWPLCLATIRPAENACLCPSSLWVVAPNHVSGLLITLSLSLQGVSSCCTLLCFRSVDDISLGCEWLLPLAISSQLTRPVLMSSVCEWLPCCALSLLMMPVPITSGCEWLPCFAVFQACWWHLFSSLQRVSGHHLLLCFKPADTSCPCSLQWVCGIPYLTTF